jgi:cell division protein FtsW (lipid II flippase)
VRLQPRTRPRELAGLLIVAAALDLGRLSLAAGALLADPELGPPASTAALGGPLADPRLVAHIAALFGAHLVLVVAGRPLDELLLPTVGLLGGLSLLLMERLPQDLAGGFGLATTQTIWLLLSLAVIVGLAVGVRRDAWLRRYKYTWAAAGIALLLVTFVLGREVNGQRLTLVVGPLSGQPSELLKVILVVFLAAYLSELRPILAGGSFRLGPLRLPPLPYLAPLVAMWVIALGVIVVQRDLGAALLVFGVFLALLYVATARWSYVVLGGLAFLAGGALLVGLFDHVRTRIDIWIDPFADAQGAGYQVVQALHALARGGILGTGLGSGLPTVAGRLPIPAVHTDLPLAALGEELGLAGLLAILGLYLVLIVRGLRIAAAARDEFRGLLAAGLALVVGVQALIIAGGTLKLVPLTGITLPFISYGGSSLLANGLAVGLLLALSERPAPERPGDRAARAGIGA